LRHYAEQTKEKHAKHDTSARTNDNKVHAAHARVVHVQCLMHKRGCAMKMYWARINTKATNKTQNSQTTNKTTSTNKNERSNTFG